MLAIGLFVFFSHIYVVFAANACTSTGTGNWSAPGTWSSCGGGIPTALDSVTILTGHIVTVNTAAVANTLTINANAAVGGNGVTISSGQSLAVTNAVTLNIPTAATTDLNVGGGTLSAGSIAIPGSGTANRFATVSVGAGTVTVTGSITFSGTAAQARYTSTGASVTTIGGDFGAGGKLTTSGTGTFNFNGSVAQVVGAYTTYNNIQINNTNGGVGFSGVTTIGGTLLVNTGILDIGGISTTVTGATTINSTLRISNITGTKTFGDLTISNGGSLNFTAAEGVTFTGNLTVNGTGAISGTTGTFIFQKVGGGTIGGTTVGTQTIAALNVNTSYSSSIPLTVTGTVTVGAGIVFTNTSTFTAGAALGGATGTFTQGVNGILNLGLTSAIGTLDATAVPNEVHYTRTTGAQTIKSTTYHHLFIEEAGQIGTLGGAIAVNGNLTVTSGTLADGGFQITGNGSGIFSLAANTTLMLGTTLTATSFPTSFTTGKISIDNASTVNYNSNIAQTISPVHSYGKLVLTATAAVVKTAAGNVTVNGNFTSGANNTLADGGFTLTLKANSTMTGPHTGGGKVLFTGGGALHSVIGSYANVELDDSNGVAQTGTVNIAGTLTVTNGSWGPNGNTLAVVGATSITGAIAISSTAGTKTFGNITINTGGVMSFSAAEAVTVNGDLTLNGTATITGTTGTWTFQKIGGGTIGGTASSLTISGGNTFATSYAILLPYTVNTMTVNSGVNETNLGTMTINTSLAGLGTLTQGASSTLNLSGGTTITTLDASASHNEVHYKSTTAPQTVRTAYYYDLFIEKGTQTGAVSGTTNVLGNLRVTTGILTLGSSDLSVGGATDIYGTLDDINNSGSATFGGLVTVYTGGNWTGNTAEACNFNFQNGFVFNGTSFTTGPGLYTFLTNNQSISGSGVVTVKNLVVTGIQLTNNLTFPLTIGTALSGTGELIQGGNAIMNLGGTATIAILTATSSGNSVNYNGALAQNVLASAYQTLDVSANTNGSLSIAGDTTVNTTLILGTNIFTANTNKIIISAGATLSRITGFINGNLQKHIGVGTSSNLFEVGTGADYTPLLLDFNAVIIPGDIVAYSTASDHSQIATADLFPNKTANRFYAVTNNGVSFTTYDATFTFVPTDVDVGANTANFVLGKFDSGVWSRPKMGAVTPTSVSGTELTSFGDFQIGEPDVVSTILVDTAHLDGAFTTGEVIDITVRYTGSVTVSGGTPSLLLNTGGTAYYMSGSGTSTLTFRYTALSGEYNADLDYMSVGALSLNGATIKNTGGGDTDNTLPSVGTFAGVHAITVGTPPPGILHVIKQVLNNNGGTAISSFFNLHVKLLGSDVFGSPMFGTGTPGTLYSLAPNTYVISEDASSSYAQNFSGDCDTGGSVTVLTGSDNTCAITNTDIPPPPPPPPPPPTPPAPSVGTGLTTVTFSGVAYPYATILVVDKDVGFGETISQNVVASADGTFQVHFADVEQSDHSFALIIKDDEGRASQTKFFNIDTAHNNLAVSDVFAPPTLAMPQRQVGRGQDIVFVGRATPGSIVRVEIDDAIKKEVSALDDGSYKLIGNTGVLEFGTHNVRAKQIDQDKNRESGYSSTNAFIVSHLVLPKTDLSGDGMVTVKDWSIFLSHWSGTDMEQKKIIDMNGDGKVDVADFSIFIRNMRKT